MSPVDFHALLAEAGLGEQAVKLDDQLVRLQWGSAFVIAGFSGSAVIAIAPLFPRLPAGNEPAFCKRLLEHNAHMGGMAAFAIQPDGWVVLQAARGVKGLDAAELATLIASVGRFADQYDDALAAEFFSAPGTAITES